MIIAILGIIAALLLVLIAYAAIVAADRADEWEEDWWNDK
jgi:hypothetical protein